MKKFILSAAVATIAMSASAQKAIEAPSFCDNWQVGLDAGVTTPMHNYAFFGSMRALVGLHVQKQLTPVFGLGAEGAFGINTSRVRGPQSANAFDNSYVGAYGAVNLMNLFGGYNCEGRRFDIEAVLGAGWGHLYETRCNDYNYFATKAGLNFNFKATEKLSFSLKPSIVWDMTSKGAERSSAAYNVNEANFNLMVGVNYNFGPGFTCVRPYDQAEVDALNATINGLRADIDGKNAENASLAAANAALTNELNACKSRKPEVVKEVNNQLNSVRYVFFKIGSSKIGADQQPNVEMIAAYLKNHPAAKVTIKGYASPDGPEEVNIRLANQRAQAVKDQLIKRYKVAADRIVAEGEGIGNMFSEESWNRVAICVLDEAK